MANHTYVGKVSNMRTLSQSMAQQGILDGALSICTEGVTKDGTIVPACVLLNETSASYGDFELACQNAREGTFLSNKTAKLEAVEGKTLTLLSSGFVYTAPSDSQVKGPFELSRDTELALERISRVTGNGTAGYPQLLNTMDGRGSLVNSDADVAACGLELDKRGVYLLGDQVNADLSLGEAALIIAIVSAADQAALDAIVDTRI